MVVFKSIVQVSAQLRRDVDDPALRIVERRPALPARPLGKSGRAEGSAIWWISCDCGSLIIAPERANIILACVTVPLDDTVV